jgi:hypothetical protein
MDGTLLESRSSNTVRVISNNTWIWKRNGSKEKSGKDNLFVNYPNPFNPLTKICFNITAGTHTKLNIYDIMGRNVSTLVNEILEPGAYEITFDGSKMANGIYFYELQTDNGKIINKMNLIK